MAEQYPWTEQENQKLSPFSPAVELLVPVYHPGEELTRLLNRMAKQSYSLGRVHLLITASEEEYQALAEKYRKIWNRAVGDRKEKVPEAPPLSEEPDAKTEGNSAADIIFTRIDPAEFDHGGTRHLGAEGSKADLLLFMTQDALPADDRLVEKLVKQFVPGLYHPAGEPEDQRAGVGQKDYFARRGDGDIRQQTAAEGEKGIAAAYARQLPNENCNPIERYTRKFNYPKQGCIKTKADLPRLGIKTYFCSNVCAMYRRDVYERQGGFICHTIFNEDMIYAAGAIQAGYGIAYAAEAKVIHSHNYSALQQFRRNFDLAVSQADHPEIFGEVSSEGEGIRMVKQTVRHLCGAGRFYLVPKLVWQSGWKYMGYLLGKHYRRLPRRMVMRFTMNPRYWNADREAAE